MSSTSGVRFARWVFGAAAVYGIPVTLLMALMPAKMLEGGPAINRPEWYYGFAAICMAWQLAFVVIARDPARLRPLMPVAVCEKLFFVAVVGPMIWRGDVPRQMIPAVAIDATWGVLFAVAFALTRAKIDGR